MRTKQRKKWKLGADMKKKDNQAHPLKAPIYELAKDTALNGLHYLVKKSAEEGNIAATECFEEALHKFIRGIELLEGQSFLKF
jgi:hypothetical protein